MNTERFPVDFSFYQESAVDSAIEAFSEIAEISKEGGELSVTVSDGGPTPDTVFDELMNYVLESEIVSP